MSKSESSDDISMEKALSALATATELANSDDDDERDFGTEAYEKATEKGFTDHQREIVEKSAGCSRMPVEESHIPTFADKLAAGKKIPWTFTYNGVEFVVKANHGSKVHSRLSQWSWHEEGYRMIFWKRDGYPDEISIKEL